MTAEERSSTLRIVPFWIHQAVEYFLAAALVATAFHVNTNSRWVLIGAGGLLIAMAAISGPPLGAWPVLGRRAHRAADWVAIVALAASPALPGRDAASILAVEAAAVALWRLSSATRFDVAPARVAEPRGPLPEPAPLDPAVDAAIRRQARVAGLTLGIIRRRRRDVRDSRSGS